MTTITKAVFLTIALFVALSYAATSKACGDGYIHIDTLPTYNWYCPWNQERCGYMDSRTDEMVWFSVADTLEVLPQSPQGAECYDMEPLCTNTKGEVVGYNAVYFFH